MHHHNNSNIDADSIEYGFNIGSYKSKRNTLSRRRANDSSHTNTLDSEIEKAQIDVLEKKMRDIYEIVIEKVNKVEKVICQNRLLLF